MTKRMNTLFKRITPFFAAGMILQATSCDVAGLTSGLATSLANTLISTLVFGIFGLAP